MRFFIFAAQLKRDLNTGNVVSEITFSVSEITIRKLK